MQSNTINCMMLSTRNTTYLVLCAVLVILTCAGCGHAAEGRLGGNDEAVALSEEIISEGLTNVEHALERVDSAEQAGLLTAIRANTVKAAIYVNADLRRMAAYHAEKATNAWAGQTISTPGDSSLYCTSHYILASGAYTNGEYGKSLALSKEILDFLGDGTTPRDIAMKSRALSLMASCETELKHIAEAERLYLQSVDILMESTQHATKYIDVDPLIFTLLTLNDLYVDNKMPEHALSLMAKLDTAMNRLVRCPDIVDRMVEMRRNNVTISKAMSYAANHQKEKAEALFREHQQSKGLSAIDKAAEGVCLTTMGRYDEAVRILDEADSMMRSNGEPITDLYVKTILKYKCDALQKAGRTEEALSMREYIGQLTDSIRQQERQADVEQLQEIKHQEEEIVRKQQSLNMHRIILIAAFLLLMLSGYIIWRIHRYNHQLAEKNRSLYEQIQQREQAEAEEQRQLQAQPEESLTAEQRLYRRLCKLMSEQKPYTDETLNRDTLAQLLGTNAKYVVQAIRECSHGDTVMDFITRYRLEHAAHLLKTTNEPIALVGELSGIPSRSTLARLFRNEYGMTCSAYREAARAQF